MNIQRIWAIAHNVFRETIRDRILYLVLVFGLLMAGAALLLPQVANQAEDKITMDLGLAAINFLALIVAIFIGTGLINKEIEKRTVYVLIAKPMSRVEFILGKHLGLVALLGVLLALMSGIFFIIVALQQASPPLMALFWAIGFIWLELVLVVAAALMFGVFTSSILATLYTIAFYLMGHFSTGLLQLSKLAEGSPTAKVFEVLFLVLPNLERLNLKNLAIYSQLPPPAEMATNALYGLIYTVLLLTIAALVFARRQF